MRKRNVTHVADTIFWWIIYTLPVIFVIGVTIAYIVACGNITGFDWSGTIDWYPEDLHAGATTSGNGVFSGYFIFDAWYDAIFDGSTVAFHAAEMFFDAIFHIYDTPIYEAFTSVWDMILPDSAGHFSYFICGSMTWFISAHIIHIFVDFIVFIPRLCHKWMGKATQED